MKHEIFDEHLEVVDTDISFESIYKRSYVSADYLADIKRANLLIIPTENFRDDGDFLFPETTRDFLDYVRDFSDSQIIPDIVVDDENFQRIELHCATI